jgi:hypothetical protein
MLARKRGLRGRGNSEVSLRHWVARKMSTRGDNAHNELPGEVAGAALDQCSSRPCKASNTLGTTAVGMIARPMCGPAASSALGVWISRMTASSTDRVTRMSSNWCPSHASSCPCALDLSTPVSSEHATARFAAVVEEWRTWWRGRGMWGWSEFIGKASNIRLNCSHHADDRLSERREGIGKQTRILFHIY